MRGRDILILTVLLLFSVGLVFELSSPPQSGTGLDPGTRTPVPPPGGGFVKRDEGMFSVLFLGDTHPGENFRNDAPEDIPSQRDPAYPFEKLRSLLLASNVVLLNLETPVIPPPPQARRYQERLYWTDASKTPGRLRELNVTVASLGHDHAFDFGSKGLQQTLDALATAGISTLGAGVHAQDAARPYRIERTVGGQTFRMAVIQGVYPRARTPQGDVEGPQVHVIEQQPLIEQIKMLKAEEPAPFVVICPHWGRSYRWAGKKDREMAHALIDAGADLIIGHGSHMIQQVEPYKGRWIVYGLGNFVFTLLGQYQRRRGSIPYSLAARMEVHEQDDALAGMLRLYPIHTDNLANAFQGRYANAKDIGDVLWHLLWKGYEFNTKLKQHLVIRVDEFGHHFEVSLNLANKATQQADVAEKGVGQ